MCTTGKYNRILTKVIIDDENFMVAVFCFIVVIFFLLFVTHNFKNFYYIVLNIHNIYNICISSET